MSRTIKNLIIIFTLLCAMVLIVFCIELVLLNRGNNGRETGPAISDNTPAGNEGAAGEQEAAGAEQSGDTEQSEDTDQNGNDTTQEGQKPPPTGNPHEMKMLDDVNTLILYADEELFEYNEGEGVWTYIYKKHENASLEVSIGLLTPQGGVDELAAYIVKNNLDGSGSTGGEKQIGNTSFNGLYISGEKNGGTYEAWILGPLEGGLESQAVVFVVSYQNEEQKEAIYSVLDTLELVSDIIAAEEAEE